MRKISTALALIGVVAAWSPAEGAFGGGAVAMPMPMAQTYPGPLQQGLMGVQQGFGPGVAYGMGYPPVYGGGCASTQAIPPQVAPVQEQGNPPLLCQRDPAGYLRCQ